MNIKNVKVADLMVRQVFSLRPDHNVHVADEMMRWENIRHIPIVDEKGKLAGLVTHRDILAASISSCQTRLSRLEGEQHLWTIPVKDLGANRDVWTAAPETPIREAARLMLDKKIGCLPVVDGDRRLVGLVTEADLIRLIASDDSEEAEDSE